MMKAYVICASISSSLSRSSLDVVALACTSAGLRQTSTREKGSYIDALKRLIISLPSPTFLTGDSSVDCSSLFCVS
jgi:hypothetical protein